jgi:hypothetical protein
VKGSVSQVLCEVDLTMPPEHLCWLALESIFHGVFVAFLFKDLLYLYNYLILSASVEKIAFGTIHGTNRRLKLLRIFGPKRLLRPRMKSFRSIFDSDQDSALGWVYGSRTVRYFFAFTVSAG